MSNVQTFGVSFAMGAILFGLSILLGWLSINYNLNANMLKWLLLPALGYSVAFGLNCLLQYVSCGKVIPESVAKGSLYVLASMFIFLLITLLGVVRAPIAIAVPLTLRAKYGGLLALSYYMFWAGMFGEAIASGFAQGCV